MNEKVSRLLKNHGAITVTAVVAAFGSGLLTGYLIGRKHPKVEIHEFPEQLELNLKIEPTNEERLAEIREGLEARKAERLAREALDLDDDDEIVEVRETITFEVIPAPDDLHAWEGPIEDIPVIDGNTMQRIEPSPLAKPVIDKSATFAHNDPDWNYQEELLKRDTLLPYVIHRDEFFADELEYDQTSLTYYSGDDIMVDEEDQPVYNYKFVTGPLLFGHGSMDENVVYIRNDKRKAEYEIMLDPGLYSIEVLGLNIENNERAKNVQHSAVRKFRPE